MQTAVALSRGAPPRLYRDALLCAADVAAEVLGDRAGLGSLAAMAERVAALVFSGDPVLERPAPWLGRATAG